MSKSILVIDTPSTCGECRLGQFIDGAFDDDMICLVRRGKIIKNNERPKWCPLNELPDYKCMPSDVFDDFEDTYDCGYDRGYQCGMSKGWNACIKKITGETE